MVAVEPPAVEDAEIDDGIPKPCSKCGRIRKVFGRKQCRECWHLCSDEEIEQTLTQHAVEKIVAEQMKCLPDNWGRMNDEGDDRVSVARANRERAERRFVRGVRVVGRERDRDYGIFRRKAGE